MSEDGKWVTIRGHRVFIKDKDVNKYMNDKIRNKGKRVFKQLKEDDYKELERKTDKIYNNASIDEKKALNRYTIDGSYDINKYLATNKFDYISYNNIDDMKYDIKQIDTIMNRNKIDDDIVVYRATTSKIFQGMDIGSEFDMPTYFSTSAKENIAEKFLQKYGMRYLGYRPVLMEMKVPKGTSGIYLGDKFNENGVNENEFLLGRNLHYKINDIKLITKEVEVQNHLGQEMGKQEREFVKVFVEVSDNGKKMGTR